MSFTMTGVIPESFGQPVRVEWLEGGHLIGDPTAISRFDLEAKLLEGTRVGFPTGPVTRTNHLESPFSTMWISAAVFTSVEYSGDVPELEDPPEGFIP